MLPRHKTLTISQPTITRYLTQSHYLDTELTSPCPILLMPSSRLLSDKNQFYKSLFSFVWKPRLPILQIWCWALPIRPPHLLILSCPCAINTNLHLSKGKHHKMPLCTDLWVIVLNDPREHGVLHEVIVWPACEGVQAHEVLEVADFSPLQTTCILGYAKTI